MTACDFDFGLRDQDFPPGTLDIETGNLVRIRTQDLRFWTIGKVVTPKKKGEYLTTLIPRLAALYRDFKATTSGH